MSSCIFCKIIAKEITGRIVYEDEQWLAFDDINPQAPVHVLIVPKEHIPTLNDLKESHMGLIGNMGVVINKIAEIKNVKDPGFRVVVNCNPAGDSLSITCMCICWAEDRWHGRRGEKTSGTRMSRLSTIDGVFQPRLWVFSDEGCHFIKRRDRLHDNHGDR